MNLSHHRKISEMMSLFAWVAIASQSLDISREASAESTSSLTSTGVYYAKLGFQFIISSEANSNNATVDMADEERL